MNSSQQPLTLGARDGGGGGGGGRRRWRCRYVDLLTWATITGYRANIYTLTCCLQAAGKQVSCCMQTPRRDYRAAHHHLHPQVSDTQLLQQNTHITTAACCDRTATTDSPVRCWHPTATTTDSPVGRWHPTPTSSHSPVRCTSVNSSLHRQKLQH